MPSPVYSAGTPGNVVSGVSVPFGASYAAFLDLSTDVQGNVTCEMTTGATAPTAGTTFGAYYAYAAGASSPITVGTGGIAAGGTSLPVSGAVGLHQNQKVALIAAAGHGEIVTLTAAPVGTGAQSIACSATQFAYAAGDKVYLMARGASDMQAPSDPATQGWAIDTDYSGAMFLGPAQWIIGITNTDTAQAVTVNVTVDRITAIQ